MADLIEAPLDNAIATFDGRVLEVFTIHRAGSVRYHVSLLSDCTIDGNILTVTYRDRDAGFWPFDEQQRPAVEALVQAMTAARGSSS